VLSGHNNTAGSSTGAEANFVLPCRTADDMVEDNSKLACDMEHGKGPKAHLGDS
jgi:hypothetical protein